MQFNKAHFATLSSKAERARYLLKFKVSAQLTIDPDKLEPAYVAIVAGHGTGEICGYHDSKEAAIAAAIKRLQADAGEEVSA